MIEKVRNRRGPIGWFFKVAFILFNVLMLAWMLSFRVRAASQLDAGGEAERAGAAIGFGLVVTELALLWLAGAVILGLPTLLTRGIKIVKRISSDAASR